MGAPPSTETVAERPAEFLVAIQSRLVPVKDSVTEAPVDCEYVQLPPE
jgi:hypothetical protein